MSEYRIRKGGREFTATRVDTLKELASRGLLRPEDAISVDGGEFLPLEELSELAEQVFAAVRAADPDETDPWRHFEDAAIDGSTEDESIEEDVLSSFLLELGAPEAEGAETSGSRRGRRVERRPPPSRKKKGQADRSPGHRTGEHVTHIVRPEPDPPPAPAVEPASEAAEPAAAPEPVEPPEPDPPAVEAASQEDLQAASSAVLAAPEAAASSSNPSGSGAGAELPVSFTEWLETKDGQEKELLSGFGRYDAGLVMPRKGLGQELNLIRIALLVFLGSIAIGFYWMWIRTVALVDYPVETELEARGPGAKRNVSPVAVLESVDQPIPAAVQQDVEAEDIVQRAREQSIRQNLRGNLIVFNTPEMLEDALFQELINRGASPASVSVESLRERGTRDIEARKPTQAHLTIVLNGVTEEGDAGYEQLQDHLILTWLLVGKYMTRGQVTFEDVTVSVEPPLPFRGSYEGRRLAAFWEKQIGAADLILQKK